LASELSSLRRQVGISADEQERNAHTRPWHIYDCVSGRFYDHVPRLKPHNRGICPFPKERLCMTVIFTMPMLQSPSLPDRQSVRWMRCEGEPSFQLRWQGPRTKLGIVCGRRFVDRDRRGSAVVMLLNRVLETCALLFQEVHRHRCRRKT
jgi:hypothetical protein